MSHINPCCEEWMNSRDYWMKEKVPKLESEIRSLEARIANYEKPVTDEEIEVAWQVWHESAGFNEVLTSFLDRRKAGELGLTER